MKDRVGEVLEGFGRDVPDDKTEDSSEETAMTSEYDRKRDAQRHMWQGIDETLGQ